MNAERMWTYLSWSWLAAAFYFAFWEKDTAAAAIAIAGSVGAELVALKHKLGVKE